MADVSRIFITDGSVGAEVGKRYLLLGVMLGLRLVSADATTFLQLVITQASTVRYIRLRSVPSVAGVYAHSWILPAEGILLDVGSGIDLEYDAAPAAYTCILTYRQVVTE